MSLHRFAHLRSLSACMVLAAVPALAQNDLPPTQPARDLPQGSTLIERALEQIGSEESRAGVKSLSLSGSMKFEGDTAEDPGVESFESKLIPPDKYHLTVHFVGGETALVVHDGEHGWETEPGSPSYNIMREEEGKMFAIIVPHGWLLSLNERFPTANTEEQIEIEGVTVYRVTLESSPDGQSADVFINAENGQFSAIELTDPDGRVVRMTIASWKEVNGLNLPSEGRLQLSAADGGVTIAVGYSEISFNDVDESTFAMPEEVKRQLPHEGDDIDDDGGF